MISRSNHDQGRAEEKRQGRSTGKNQQGTGSKDLPDDRKNARLEDPSGLEQCDCARQKKFKETYTRGMLSQNKWDGRKLIAEAFSEAKKVQKKMQNDSAPKYKTASRALLQNRILEQDATILALKEELEEVRAQQVDRLDAFLNTRCDLQKLLDRVQERKLPKKQVKDDDDIPW